MADIGLYTLKYPFRKLIAFLVPLCKNISPNMISLMLIPLGVVTACNYYCAPACPSLYLVGIVLIFLRLIVATLDGLVAVTYGKDSPYGEMVNRMCPEVCDLLLMISLVLCKPWEPWLIALVLCFAWATSFLGLVGLTGKRPIQSVGPVGQTDRLVALMIFSLLQFISVQARWGFDFVRLFFYWLILGGTLTLILRSRRSLMAP